MMAEREDGPSIADRIRPLDAGALVAHAHFLGESVVFALAEEELIFATLEGEQRRVIAHGGGILASACDGKRLVTGGDDGKILATTGDGKTETLVTDAKRRWIDHVALGRDGALAWSAGKTAFARPVKGEERALDFESTVGGLAFAPKGFRLAVAHYNGVSFWFPNAQAKPERYEWKGSHLGVSISPDGKFLITTMQEPAMHGWRVADHRDMRMSGYPARIRSMSWTSDGQWLATSGAEQLILWPFQSKDGPMGKQPRAFAVYPERVTVVAAHPHQGAVATGYNDGMILLVRIDDGAEILARKPDGAAVTALAWNASGTTLAFGCEDGAAGLMDVSAPA